MSVAIERIDNIPVILQNKRILTLIGYKRRRRSINESVLALIAEEKERASRLIHPESIYTVCEHSETNEHPIFDQAEKTAFCLCTIGPELETHCAAYFRTDDTLRGLILDAIGSEAAEQVARHADTELAKIARKMGLWPSKRFSPGYRNWDLSEQSLLFKILPAENIGITLNDSFMMNPRKSVSFGMNFYRDKGLTTRKMSF